MGVRSFIDLVVKDTQATIKRDNTSGNGYQEVSNAYNRLLETQGTKDERLEAFLDRYTNGKPNKAGKAAFFKYFKEKEITGIDIFRNAASFIYENAKLADEKQSNQTTGHSR
jgi:hypothetical protein